MLLKLQYLRTKVQYMLDNDIDKSKKWLELDHLAFSFQNLTVPTDWLLTSETWPYLPIGYWLQKPDSTNQLVIDFRKVSKTDLYPNLKIKDSQDGVLLLQVLSISNTKTKLLQRCNGELMNILYFSFIFVSLILYTHVQVLNFGELSFHLYHSNWYILLQIIVDKLLNLWNPVIDFCWTWVYSDP